MGEEGKGGGPGGRGGGVKKRVGGGNELIYEWPEQTARTRAAATGKEKTC